MRTVSMIRNIKNWRDYLTFKYFKPHDPEFVFQTKAGAVKVPRRLLHTFKESFFDAKYFSGFPAEVLRKPNPVVFDIGANVGYFSIYAIAELHSPRVYSFEPVPRNFKLMEEYKASLGYQQWFPEDTAISDSTGEITLYLDSGSEFTTSASVNASRYEKDGVKVTAWSLDDALKNLGLSSIDILKLDCEGSEYPILYSLSDTTLAKIHAITMEVPPVDQIKNNQAGIVGYLRSKNFKVVEDRGDIVWAINRR